jgi:acyl-coenzyme A thioesterase PaaI-like protein
MRELPHTHGCFVCGESNPAGLRLRFHTDGKVVRAEFVPRVEHVGFATVVHGGIVSTVLDEIMVWACAVATHQFGYCAELTVRFQHPLRPGHPAVAEAELVSNRRNRVFEARGEIRDGVSGQVLASATGKYLPLKAEEAQSFLPDLIGGRLPWMEKGSDPGC